MGGGGGGGGVVADLSEKMPWDLEQIKPNTFFPNASCVIFAKRAKKDSHALGDKAQCWLGKLEELEEHGRLDRKEIAVADASSDDFVSPYAEKARQGATITPRVFYFVDVEQSLTALAKDLVKVSPQRSSQEKKPWKNLQPTELIGASIEKEHIWDIHLGETVAPYVLLEPRRVVLPIRQGETLDEPKVSDATICGVKTSAMESRMRERWKIINRLWDENKTSNNRLDLADRLNYQKGLSYQLKEHASIRLFYTTSGRPTAAVIDVTQSSGNKCNEQLSTDKSGSAANIDSDIQSSITNAEPNEVRSFTALPITLADTRLYWLKCETLEEGHYLTAVINSGILEQSVQKFMSKGQFGARDLHKHLWRLPIPIYEEAKSLHFELATLGAQLSNEVPTKLAAIRAERAAKDQSTTITVARRELRSWLSSHPPAQQVEQLVTKLLQQS